MNKVILSFILIVILSFQINSQSSAEIFYLGMKAFNNKDYVEANDYFDSFFQEHNENDEIYATAKYYSGESLLSLGEKNAASERFEFLVNNFKWSVFRDAALYKMGLIYFVRSINLKNPETDLTLWLMIIPAPCFVAKTSINGIFQMTDRLIA